MPFKFYKTAFQYCIFQPFIIGNNIITFHENTNEKSAEMSCLTPNLPCLLSEAIGCIKKYSEIFLNNFFFSTFERSCITTS